MIDDVNNDNIMSLFFNKAWKLEILRKVYES